MGQNAFGMEFPNCNVGVHRDTLGKCTVHSNKLTNDIAGYTGYQMSLGVSNDNYNVSMSKFYTGKVNDQWRLIRRTIPTQYYPDRDFQFRVEANFDARIRFVWTIGNYLEIGLGVDRDSAKNGIWANGQLKSESFIPSEEYLTDTTQRFIILRNWTDEIFGTGNSRYGSSNNIDYATSPMKSIYVTTSDRSPGLWQMVPQETFQFLNEQGTDTPTP